MLVAAGIFLQQGVADVIERRTVLVGGERAKRRAGNILKPHAGSFLAPAPNFKSLEKLYDYSAAGEDRFRKGKRAAKPEKLDINWV